MIPSVATGKINFLITPEFQATVEQAVFAPCSELSSMAILLRLGMEIITAKGNTRQAVQTSIGKADLEHHRNLWLLGRISPNASRPVGSFQTTHRSKPAL